MSKIWDWIMGGTNFFLVNLVALVPGMVAKVLATFGFTLITLKGVLPQLKQFVLNLTGGLPGPAMEMLGALGIGTAMSMVFSALLVRMATKVFFVPTAVADSLKSGGLPL